MIARGDISRTLKSIDSKFRGSTSNRDSLLFSKLAILELCGWIEGSMDDVVMRCARRHLNNQSNIQFVQDKIVIPTWGFEYEKHFKGMLIKLIGLINFKRLERTMDKKKRNDLEATLSSLKKVRHRAAHTHIRGVTPTINAPSVTLAHFEKVYSGLIEFDRVLRKL